MTAAVAPTGYIPPRAARIVSGSAKRGRRLTDLPGAELGCHPADAADGKPSGTHYLAFCCDDIVRTVGELRERGVEFTGGIADVGSGVATPFPGAGRLRGGAVPAQLRVAPAPGLSRAEEPEMPDQPQCRVTLEVGASLADVWEAIEDVSLMPEHHPVVRQVELVSGSSRRAPGVSYKCIVPGGRRAGWCVETVVEQVPFQRTTVAFPADSWGLSRWLDGFTTELSVAPGAAPDRARVALAAFYRPIGWRGRISNAVGLRRLMRRRARQTLERLARLIERGRAAAPAGTP